jgi:flagellar biosynthesis/type III secretory pathway protein FliH
MSSFRIDRQYVAFETAETQPVCAANAVKKTSPVKDDDMSADLSRLYNEIYEKLQREHAEQAELMLSRAAAEAEEITRKAREQAEEILRQAKREAEALKEELIAEMTAAEAERKIRAENALSELEAQLRSDYEELVDGMRGKVVALVMEIVRKVIGIRMEESDEVFTNMVKDALDRLKQTGSVLIRVGPEDYARYLGAAGGSVLEVLDTGETKITAVEEPNFSKGDLVVESEGEIVNLSINRQLELIENAFLT